MPSRKRPSAPRLPHERDESADSQRGTEPSAQQLGEASQADAQRGSVDTDKGPVLDRTYQRVKKPSS
jgi:hypothetical protein